MSVSVMKSYRNFIPANPATVLRMFQIMLRLDLDYERVYGSLPGDDIKAMGKQIVMSSLREYLMWSCREKELEEPWSTSKSV